MEDIRRKKSNPMVELSKFTSNKKNINYKIVDLDYN